MSLYHKLDQIGLACNKLKHWCSSECHALGMSRKDLFELFPLVGKEFYELREERRSLEERAYKRLSKITSSGTVQSDRFKSLSGGFKRNLESAKQMRKTIQSRNVERKEDKEVISSLTSSVNKLRSELKLAEEDFSGFQYKMRQHFELLKCPEHLIKDILKWKLDDPFFTSCGSIDQARVESEDWSLQSTERIQDVYGVDIGHIILDYASISSSTEPELRALRRIVQSNGCTYDRFTCTTSSGSQVGHVCTFHGDHQFGGIPLDHSFRVMHTYPMGVHFVVCRDKTLFTVTTSEQECIRSLLSLLYTPSRYAETVITASACFWQNSRLKKRNLFSAVISSEFFLVATSSCSLSESIVLLFQTTDFPLLIQI